MIISGEQQSGFMQSATATTRKAVFLTPDMINHIDQEISDCLFTNRPDMILFSLRVYYWAICGIIQEEGRKGRENLKDQLEAYRTTIEKRSSGDKPLQKIYVNVPKGFIEVIDAIGNAFDPVMTFPEYSRNAIRYAIGVMEDPTAFEVIRDLIVEDDN